MPRTYVRKTEKAQWTENELEAAITAIQSGRKIREVGRSFNIPESTLRDKLKININTKGKLGRKPVFNDEQETAIASHVIKLANIFFGITPAELRRLAYQFADVNKIKHRFDQEKKMAGQDWLELFLKRHPEISLRKPEGTSQNRISAFNKPEVERFFNNLLAVMEKYKFSESKIYNVDETGISTVQKPAKILAPKGQKQVGSVISWERGKNVTVVCAVSASGQFVSPMFIFPRARMNPQLMRDGPIGAVYRCSKNGWINEELFFDWIKHFHQHVKSSEKDPVLLILDNHGSHISLEIYAYCRSNGIVMVSLPPHTSHRLQPLDLTFFGPLKNALNRECDLYLRNHPHEKITHYELASIFNKAYLRVATMDKGISGFRAAGIWPTDPDKFSEDDFSLTGQPEVPDIQIDINLNETHVSNRDNIMEQSTATVEVEQKNKPQLETSRCSEALHRTPPKKTKWESHQEAEPQPGTSGSNKRQFTSSCSNVLPSLQIPIEKLAPLPGPIGNKGSKSRAKQHSEIFTSTPLKTQLEIKQEKRNLKKKNEESTKSGTRKRKAEKVGKPVTKAKKRPLSKKPGLRNLHFDDSDSESYDESQLCDDDELDDVDPSGDNEECLVCGEFGRDNEIWYRCVMCSNWAHSECSGWESAVNYTCDMCANAEKKKDRK
ncbi:hypothetical protein NQ318_020401 [Aromia moschata]|uniref:HTH CENPB-type domain-containing protein n=1 Tax=Aromia moschata TaxID=1265417 RepID=A0AAV8Y4S8_9CUCU|nr:hypothetical protein NQ318_020401 [Aromia moschata]